jgi:hypothetical protein
VNPSSQSPRSQETEVLCVTAQVVTHTALRQGPSFGDQEPEDTFRDSSWLLGQSLALLNGDGFWERIRGEVAVSFPLRWAW